MSEAAVKTVTLTIDGREVPAEQGQTILEAAKAKGIGIPTLCDHPTVEAYGACRMCLVEASAHGRKRLVTSCNYEVADGLAVDTNSERVRRSRRLTIELLLARCPDVRVIQELADEYGVEKPRFSLGDHDCILCGLCVRSCQEIIGRSAISLVNRGIYKEVAAPFYAYELGEGCIGCGDCSYVCPTGAITMGASGKPVLPRVKIPYAEIGAMMSKEKTSAPRE